MIGRADIEGSKSNVAMNAWLPQASSLLPTPHFVARAISCAAFVGSLKVIRHSARVVTMAATRDALGKKKMINFSLAFLVAPSPFNPSIVGHRHRFCESLSHKALFPAGMARTLVGLPPVETSFHCGRAQPHLCVLWTAQRQLKKNA